MLVCLNNIQCGTLWQTAKSYGEFKKILGSVKGSNEQRVLDLMEQPLLTPVTLKACLHNFGHTIGEKSCFI